MIWYAYVTVRVVQSLACMAGNLLTLVCVVRYRYLRTPANVLVASLALSDFLHGVVTGLLQPTRNLATTWSGRKLLCMAGLNLEIVTVYAQFISFALLAVERWSSLMSQLSRGRKWGMRSVLALVCCGWTASGAWNVVVAIRSYAGIVENTPCTAFTFFPPFYARVAFGFFVITSVVIVVFYGLIACTALRSNNKVTASSPVAAATAAAANNVATTGHHLASPASASAGTSTATANTSFTVVDAQSEVLPIAPRGTTSADPDNACPSVLAAAVPANASKEVMVCTTASLQSAAGSSAAKGNGNGNAVLASSTAAVSHESHVTDPHALLARRRRERDFRITRMMALVVGVFFALYAPFFVVALCISPASPLWVRILFYVSITVYDVNFWINPVIYAWRNRNFRRAFSDVLRRLCSACCSAFGCSGRRICGSEMRVSTTAIGPTTHVHPAGGATTANPPEALLHNAKPNPVLLLVSNSTTPLPPLAPRRDIVDVSRIAIPGSASSPDLSS